MSEYFDIDRDADGVEFVRCGNEVLVVPLAGQGEVLLIEEPSAAFGKPTLVLPGGSVERNEEHRATANRELQEEIGLRAARLDFLGELHPFSKYLTVRSFLYLARDLTPFRLRGDEPHEIRSRPISIGRFEEEVDAGSLADARVIAALCLARRFLAG